MRERGRIYINFINVNNAFDFIVSGVGWKILSKSRIPDEYTMLIKILCYMYMNYISRELHKVDYPKL